MAVSKTVLVIAFIIGSTLPSQTTRKTSPTTGKTTMSTTRKTTHSSRATTASPYNPTTHYYYLDSNSDCDSYGTKYFSKKTDALYVKPWRSYPHIARVGGCTLIFSSYSNYGMKFWFTSIGYIGDCSVKLNIYSGSSAYGTPKKTYTCHNYPSSSQYLVPAGVITIELVNPYQSNNFDFTLYATSYYEKHPKSGGEVAGIYVGVFVPLFIFACLFVIICRRRRARILRGPPLITTTTSSSTYPATQTAYPPPPPYYGSTTYPPPGLGYPAGATSSQPPLPSYNQPPPPPVHGK